MGEFKDRSDLIYQNIMDRLEEEGYSDIPDRKKNKIVDLINDVQLDGNDEFEELVKDAIVILKG